MQKIEDLVFSPNNYNLPTKSLNLWVIEALRIGIYFFAVIISVIEQVLNPFFVNFEIWLPVYISIIIGLILHFGVIFSYSKIKNVFSIELAVFIIDTLFITLLSYFTYHSYPIFVILFLVNIVLCSFVMGSSISFLVAGVTSFFYTYGVLARLTEINSDQITYILNLIIFYFTAILSGYLGDLLISRGLQLKETQSNLSDLKNLSQIIIQNIGTGLVSFESNKNVSFFNDSARKILGPLVKDSSFIESHILITESDQKQHTRRVEHDLEINGIRKNLEFIATFIPDQEMKTRWVLLIQDLTEIKSLQKELALKEKLAAIGQLAGGIAHEIRNPLASISGSVEMLKETISDLSPENTKLFSIIIKEIDRLNLLITDFLNFVRPEVKRTDEISIKVLLEDILTLLKNDKKLTANVDFKVTIEDVKIKCDKAKLTQAFLNIITNALQALTGVLNPEFICNVKKEGFFISIEFTDNGLGMDDQVASRIFEPFFTTKEKGTGLGLAITHRIIEGHTGIIKVSSEVKKGTTFFIRLPIK